MGGCEGSNLFPSGLVPALPTPEEGFRAQLLRYFEEGTLLLDDDIRLRFRWNGEDPRIQFHPAVLPRERAAVSRAVAEVGVAGGPSISLVEGGGTIWVESFPPGPYRFFDPRPWSFSRTFVVAGPERGITGAEILLSQDLPQRELERAALHALGHAVGIMGHPAFPGDIHVMAPRPEGGRVPTTFAPIEGEAIRFLYSPSVRPGMTRAEIREVFRTFPTREGG